MDLENRQEVYQMAIDKWGHVAQMEMLQEEATELAQSALKLALSARKFMRKDTAETFKNLASEMADVEIMIEQMKFMFPSIDPMVEEQKRYKVNRLKKRVENNTFTE
ncbi:hypothetical protein [Chryseobacterium lathyri]|uniref:Uncharacterized protein n=1 Tax=Chryseobacterium lathyri TaxID=395933 RepID=A0A511YG03_9FLAO|nr:hypothetical protein [Chryseobacterium lathyri]GEN74103.1 hypothetical protein CLA01_41750 [Chryseobacterium lathyri]